MTLFTKAQFEELQKMILRTQKELEKILMGKGEIAEDGSGDRWHSAEFMAAYVQEVETRKRLTELKRLSAKAEIVEPKQQVAKVDIGSKALIEYENGSREKITLEGYLIKPDKHQASAYSPLGKVLKGAKVGQTKTFKIEGLKRKIKILEIYPARTN